MFKNTPRPSHGDYGWMMKYGNYDYNGGGRGSGRVTIGHVIGGAIAKKLLKTQNIEFKMKINKNKKREIEENFKNKNLKENNKLIENLQNVISQLKMQTLKRPKKWKN